uniref:Uncharacterized protein n=1 Tax=Arundo donax TaxID=35708 RepID=A0A0A9CLC0_ARUDO
MQGTTENLVKES